MILRRAKPDDSAQLLPLIHNHAAYEHGMAALLPEVLDDLLRQPDPPVHLFVAEIEDLAGYAAMTIDYALWQGARAAHLDCLFVTEPHRGLGIGGVLLQLVAKATKEAGAAWMEWQTVDFRRDVTR